MPSITINKANAKILTQDTGRWGMQALGISSGGASDKQSLHWANSLVGNKNHACVLEFFLGGAELHFSHATRIAISGADCRATLNGDAVTNWTALDIDAGDTLKLSLPSSGLYSYIAVKNGVDMKPVLGSTAITTREAIGPNNGCGFASGEQIKYVEYTQRQRRKTLHWQHQPDYNENLTARIVPSALATKSDIAWSSIEQSEYTIKADSNKMGLRLEGHAIALKNNHEFSEGVVEGCIQITPNGQPIVLMADHQTIGGYPLLGCVYAADIPLLAQRRPGQKVRFKKGCVEQALDALSDFIGDD